MSNQLVPRSAEIAYARESVQALKQGAKPNNIGLILEIIRDDLLIKSRQISQSKIDLERLKKKCLEKLHALQYSEKPSAKWNVMQIQRADYLGNIETKHNQSFRLQIEWTKFQLDDLGPKRFIEMIVQQMRIQLSLWIRKGAK